MLIDKAPQHLLTGQAGVYRVMSELMLRGVNVYLPIVDVGIDIILGNDLRVQVKAANLRTQKMKSKKGPYEYGPAYFWSLNSSQVGAKHKYIHRKLKYSDQVHYMVFWGIDEDRFWIVPASITDTIGHLALFPRVPERDIRSARNLEILTYEDRWDLLTLC